MVEERQRRRLNSDGSSSHVKTERQSRLRSASSGSTSSYSGPAGGRRASANAASTAAMATAMYFHQPPARHRRHEDGEHFEDGFYDDHDALSDDGNVGARRRGSSSEHASRLQTLPGELVLTRAEHVRARLLEGHRHLGTLYVTTYRVVFSPDASASRDGIVNDNTHTRWGVAAIPTREDELPFTSDLRNAPVTSYQAIPLLTVERARKKETAETDRGVIDIVCKDFRRVQFEFDGLISKQTFGAFDRAFQLIRQYALGEQSSHGNSNDLSRSPSITPRRYPGEATREANDYFCFAKHSREYFPPPPPRAGAYVVDSDDDWHDGWQLYDPAAELERMGVTATSLLSSPSSRTGVAGPSQWRISESNKHYELCATYPASIAVPAAVSDAVLQTAAKFRSKSRIPVLAWRDKRTGAVICRSSQPLVGLGQKQCDKDVFLIQAIAASNPSSSKMIIIDARPWKNAVAQKTVGRAGYELTEQYETRHATASLKFADMIASEQSALTASGSDSGDASSGLGNASPGKIRRRSAETNIGGGKPDAGARPSPTLVDAIDPSLVLTECKLIFMGIENIHAMRKSYNKLQELCCPSPANLKASTSNEKWLEQLASTRWIEHISRILDSAVEIVRVIKEQRASVLVHCSDGWDRTAQLTALAEIMLDPFYRTIRGFQVLVEKEWCSFGHKFRERLGHRTRGKGSGGASGSGINTSSGGGPSSSATAALSSTLSQSEVSPVFLQWIDCVWQLLMQFPCAFEFNERYLMIVLDHLYSCRFGTFLYDSERERVREEARRPTVSLWTYLRTIDRAVIENPFYYGVDKRSFQQRKRPASIIATRQCFEARTTREREGAVLYATMPPLSLDSSMGSCGENAISAIGEMPPDRNSFLPRSTIVMPRPGSLSSESSASSSSFEFDSTMAVALSTSDSKGDDADEFDALVDKLNTGLELPTITKIDNDATNSSSGNSAASEDDEAVDSADSFVVDEITFENNSALARYHRIVRDLDSGFTFPQALDELSGMSDTSPSIIPSFVPLKARARADFDSPASPMSMPLLPVPSSPVFPADSDAYAPLASPPRRPSLSSLFVPLVDRPPLSSGGGMGVNSEEDDDVITPSCAVKSLRFWSRYYLRWDPTVSGGDREANVELEAMHRDLQRECGVMNLSLSSLRRELRRIYKQTTAAASASIPDRRHSEPVSRKTPVRRAAKGVKTPKSESVKLSVKASPIEQRQGAVDQPAQPNGAVTQVHQAKSSLLHVNISANDGLAGEALSRRLLIETQIARLREQKQERMSMVEKSFDAQITRLLRQQEELNP